MRLSIRLRTLDLNSKLYSQLWPPGKKSYEYTPLQVFDRHLYEYHWHWKLSVMWRTSRDIYICKIYHLPHNCSKSLPYPPTWNGSLRKWIWDDDLSTGYIWYITIMAIRHIHFSPIIPNARVLINCRILRNAPIEVDRSIMCLDPKFEVYRENRL